MRHDEAGVVEPGFAPHPFQIGFPAFAIGRIGEHEVELTVAELVSRQRRLVCSAHNVLGLRPLPLQQEVGLAHGVGFIVDLLPKQVNRNLLAARLGQFQQCLLGHCQHAARSAGSIVK